MRRAAIGWQSVAALGAIGGATLLAAGCGGGGGGGNAKALARQRSADAVRVARTTFAVAGLGKRITRAVGSGGGAFGLGNRIPLLLAALHIGRAPASGQDPDSGLYYRETVNADGSGRQDLFSNATYTTPAGGFVWAAPKWANGQPGAYPADILSNFTITAGQYAGSHGTLEVKVDDSSGESDLLNIVLDDAMHDHCTCQLKLLSGVLNGFNNVECADGDDYTESDSCTGDVIDSNIDYGGGCYGNYTYSPDGSGTETYSDAQGSINATGDITDTGTDTVDYSDGSSDTIDTNTGDDSSSDGGDSGGDSSDSVHVVRSKPANHR